MSSDANSTLAPLSLTLWGCGIMIVWWGIVLSILGGAAWLVITGARLVLGD